MKIAFIHLALLGLSSTGLAMMNRPPLRPSSPGNHLKDAIINGLKDWGPAGSLKPPTGQNPPIKNMPGAVPTHHKPKDPNQKTGVTRVPGQPLGPEKKCRPCFRKRQICCDGGRKPTKPSKPTPKPPSRVNKGTRPAYKPSRFKVPKSAGKAAAFMLVAPYAHKALDAIKSMDNPVGHGVTWFDDSMADFQESIGGPQRDDIYGNELKHKMITSMGSALQLGFETTWQTSERLVKEAAAREEARRQEAAKEKERIMGLEQLFATCAEFGAKIPESTPLGKAMRDHCNQVATALRKVQAREVGKSRSKRATEPDYWFEKCKSFGKLIMDMQCNRTQLPELGAVCGDECRVIISLTGP
ncbi:hypothetical protein CRV24_010396 [Beauveria bassiana]|nr:hypothetical protein CRV24_010396 [Beauveria bassiana]